ncbi:MAG: peptidase T [Succinivibrio sp.]|nr:peptidase T [Succinivibrio sp.]
MAQQGSVKDLENRCGVDPLVRIFRELIAYDTTSDPESKAVPSTLGQLRLGAYLAAQCSAMGYEVNTTPEGLVVVRVAASAGREQALGLCLLAHLDTSPDAKGSGIVPLLLKDYQGGGIELGTGRLIDEQICPQLEEHRGDDFIITDGTTLLGADDKAGVAILLQLLHELKLKNLEHGPLTVVFTVDEEIGLSSQYVDVESLGCAFGVTLDGGELGTLDVATFNAQEAEISIEGRSIHTGSAYKKMVNASLMAARLIDLLPPGELPEQTQGKEGFYHVLRISSCCEKATVRMLLRDFTQEGLQRRQKLLYELGELLNRQCGYQAVRISIKDQYRNFAEVLKEQPQILEFCRKAYAQAGVTVKEEWVRGGTDGSNLSFRGLPCPNLFTGALNCHGVYECLSLKTFSKAFEVVCNLVELIAKESA